MEKRTISSLQDKVWPPHLAIILPLPLVLSCFIVFTSVFFASASPQHIASPDMKTLRVGSSLTYPPIEFRDSDTNSVMGVSHDLLTEVARRMRVRLEWVQCEYGALITGAMANRFDIVSGGISDQPARERKLDFVNYLKVGTGILVLQDDVDKYQSLLDFSGKKVAFTFGATKTAESVSKASEELLREGRTPIIQVLLPSATDAKMQLDLKRVNGYLNEIPTLEYLRAQKPGKYAIVGNGKYILSPVITSWGFLKNNQELRNAVHAALRELFQDGTYHDILRKWGLANYALEEITLNHPYVAPK